MSTFTSAFPDPKHPDEIDWFKVDFTKPLEGDAIQEIVRVVPAGVDVLTYAIDGNNVRLRLAGGAPTTLRPAVINIVVQTDTDRTLACDAQLIISRH